MSAQVKIQLKKSLQGRLPQHQRIAYALGLRKIRQEVVRPDTPIIWGMIKKIEYLVEVKKSNEG
jgi:large subunit ribosomal protein L30